MKRGTVSMRVAFVLRSAEVYPLFRDLCPRTFSPPTHLITITKTHFFSFKKREASCLAFISLRTFLSGSHLYHHQFIHTPHALPDLSSKRTFPLGHPSLPCWSPSISVWGSFFSSLRFFFNSLTALPCLHLNPSRIHFSIHRKVS